MSDLQYQAVYNILSFTLASMSATTMYLWFRADAVADKYKSAVYISGLVTFIAAYHYIRIFNSWVDAYSYEGVPNGERPKLTGVPFNDAYRYMDWLLTVPLLLIEILLVMKLDGDNFSSRTWTLGVGSALMIASGYYGELVVTGDLTSRWVCWFLSMSFFLALLNCTLHMSIRTGCITMFMTFNMSDLQYQAVYNILSFTLASISAITMYLWFRADAVAVHFQLFLPLD